MYYLIALFILIIILIVIVIFNQRAIDSLSFAKSKIKGRVVREVLSKDIDRDILIELAKYEKFLYNKGFTRRVIIESSEHSSEQRRVYYKFYYYNLLEGIHCFIMYNPYSKLRRFYFHFETRFNSKKSAISSMYQKYVASQIPDNIYFFKHSKNSTIEELYQAHKRDRVIRDEMVYKARLDINTLLKSDIYKSATFVKTDSSNREKSEKKPTKKVDILSNIPKLQNRLCVPKIDKNIYYIAGAVAAILLFLAVAYKTIDFNKSSTKTPYTTALDTNKELQEFNRNIALYSGLKSSSSNVSTGVVSNIVDRLSNFYEAIGVVGSKDSNSSNLSKYFAELDSYLSSSKFQRKIASGYRGKIKSSNSCKLPRDLDKLLAWHNGVEQFVPNGDLLSWEKIDKSIKSKNSYIFLVADKELNYGVAFNCNKDGLYRATKSNKSSWEKEFYDIKHFLKVVATAYKVGAFYDSNSRVKVDLKKYYKIYRDSLSKEDKKRYLKLVEYLKEKAKIYKTRASKELRVKLIKEIKKLYEPKLENSLKEFLNDKNLEVKREAISALFLLSR